MHDASNELLATQISCRGVTVEFSDKRQPNGKFRAVDGVDVSFSSGKVTTVIGPSGCGKTTLLRLLAGLELASQGEVKFDPPLSLHDGDIAFVFQQPSLLPWLSAIENVMLPLELVGGITKAERRSRADALLAEVELSEEKDRKPHQLSGGMKMRVSIARALVTSPSLLLLDEPFAALDDMLRASLGSLLARLRDEHGFTAIMVTHNIAEAIMLSHHIVVMGEGCVLETFENPFSWPRQESVRRTSEFGKFYGRVTDSLRGNP